MTSRKKSDEGKPNSASRVHFPKSVVTKDQDHSGKLNVEVSPDKKHIDAHIGFLYHISVPMPFYLGDLVESVDKHQNMKLFESKPDEKKSTHLVVIELKTCEDGKFSQDFAIKGSAVVGVVVVTMTGRCIGPKKGTPTLKLGVKCVANEIPKCEYSEGDVLKGKVDGSESADETKHA